MSFWKQSGRGMTVYIPISRRWRDRVLLLLYMYHNKQVKLLTLVLISGEFEHLQRWNIIKKRYKGNSNARTGSQLSEVHLAARRALNMALDQPGLDSLKASSSLGRTKSSITTNTSIRPIIPDTPSTSAPVQDQACDDFALTKTFPIIRPKTSPKSLLSNVPDPVKAAAVAAGARIATQSAAAAILKQQLKSAIHIKTNVSKFRDLHSPSVIRPQDHNLKVAQENAGNVTKVESSVLNKTVQDNNTSEKEVKENTALPVDGHAIMETCTSESAKQEQ